MARYRAVVEYDGTEFRGFQRQAAGRTVQGEIEGALGRLGWTGQSILGAGRTDSGVHAAGQVVAFDLGWAHDEATLGRALNANLPEDIAIRMVEVCAPAFHPRYDARARHYRYTIFNGPARSALRARYTWHVAARLDLQLMQAAADRLMGTHDFATFGTDPDGGANTVRTISQAQWSGGPAELHFDIQAEAFLFRMVRSLVGALKQVGAGGLTPDDLEARLRARDRAQCPPLAPAQGLCLMEVLY
jgi:tRNA pseudouridine38-40 synthase